MLSLVVLRLCLAFLICFLQMSFDVRQGRISKHTIQISLKPIKFLPLRFSSVLTPVKPELLARSLIPDMWSLEFVVKSELCKIISPEDKGKNRTRVCYWTVPPIPYINTLNGLN